MQSEPREVVNRVAQAIWEQWGQWEIRVSEEMMPEIAHIAIAALDHDFATRTDGPTDAVERLRNIAEGGTFGLFDGETVEVNVGDLRAALAALPPSGEVERRTRDALNLAEQFLDKAAAYMSGVYRGSPEVLLARIIEVRSECDEARAALRNSDGETK